MSWVLALGGFFRTFFTSPLGAPAGISVDMSLFGVALYNLIKGKFSLTKLDGFSGALAQGRERDRRKKLRLLSYVQIAAFVGFAAIAAIYVYLVVPVKEGDAPCAAQSIAFCVLAISSAVILLAALWMLFLSKSDNE